MLRFSNVATVEFLFFLFFVLPPSRPPSPLCCLHLLCQLRMPWVTPGPGLQIASSGYCSTLGPHAWARTAYGHLFTIPGFQMLRGSTGHAWARTPGDTMQKKSPKKMSERTADKMPRKKIYKNIFVYYVEYICSDTGR